VTGFGNGILTATWRMPSSGVLYIQFRGAYSQATLAAELNRQLLEDFPVNDVIVGTRVNGTGQLTGTLTGRLQPSVGHGVLEMSLQGQTITSTTGCIRRASVSSTAVTQLRGTKHLVIDPGGIHPLPATVRADTQIPTMR